VDSRSLARANTWQQHQGKEGNKKETSGIPILRYGKGNNFYQFKQTLSEVSLREFGNLGKLIQRGTYFQPEYVPPSLPDNITSTMQNSLTLEALKEHQKALDKMKNE
jgi:hypothetical protein